MTLDTVPNYKTKKLINVESRFFFIASEKKINILFLDYSAKYL